MAANFSFCITIPYAAGRPSAARDDRVSCIQYDLKNPKKTVPSPIDGHNILEQFEDGHLETQFSENTYLGF